MRILILLLFLIWGYSVMAQQWLVGGGIIYCYVDGPGINVSKFSKVRLFAEYKHVLHLAKFDVTTGLIFEL